MFYKYFGVVVAHYAKGANAERELIHLLYDRGFAVVRVAGSGKTALPCPDIVALAPRVKLAFECKAWDKEHLNITTAQMDELYKWCARAGAEFYIAWKVPHKGWLFLPGSFFKKTPKGYSISRRKALIKHIDLEVIAGLQKKLK